MFEVDMERAHEAQRASPGIEVIPGETAALELRELELDRPGGEPLLTSITATIQAKSKIVVCGPSGSGKSTLLRAIAGIWPFGHGVVRTPRRFNALFLPQRAYFPLGTLREAVCYPSAPDAYSEERLLEVLREVGLSRLSPRLNESANWSEELSGADQQRIGFARALLQQPGWLFCDEATSHLDDSSQAKLYQLLNHQMPDATIVTVTGRGELAQHHTETWELRGSDGGVYELLDLKTASP